MHARDIGVRQNKLIARHTSHIDFALAKQHGDTFICPAENSEHGKLMLRRQVEAAHIPHRRTLQHNGLCHRIMGDRLVLFRNMLLLHLCGHTIGTRTQRRINNK